MKWYMLYRFQFFMTEQLCNKGYTFWAHKNMSAADSNFGAVVANATSPSDCGEQCEATPTCYSYQWTLIHPEKGDSQCKLWTEYPTMEPKNVTVSQPRMCARGGFKAGFFFDTNRRHGEASSLCCR